MKTSLQISQGNISQCIQRSSRSCLYMFRSPHCFCIPWLHIGTENCTALSRHYCLTKILRVLYNSQYSNRVWAQTCRCSCAHTHPQCVFCAMQKEMAGHLIGLRSTCISQVLGTDMKKHFEILSRFQVNPSHPHLPRLHPVCLCCSSVVHTTPNG